MAVQRLASSAIGLLGLLVPYLLVKYIISSKAAYKYKRAYGCQEPPKLPQSERIIGYQLLKEGKLAMKARKTLEENTRRAEATGNTYSAALLGRTFYVTREPENIKTVLATNFKQFSLGERIYAFGPLLGSGIFTSDGAHWEHSRALIRPNFNKAQVANLETFETHFQHLISKLPTDGSTVDLQPLFFNMTLDSATDFLFGESINSQLASEGSESQKFQYAFDFAQSRMPARNRLGRLNLFLPDLEFSAACKTVHGFADRYVARTLESRSDVEKASQLASEKATGAKERYIFLNELAKSITDPKQLRDEMLNVLLAGRDTTASLLANTFHALARNPEIWKKLKSEVDTLEGRLPDYECLKNMEYLKWVLNEALRLYPPVPTNARFCTQDTLLPRGGGPDGQSPIFVPKGAIIMYSVYSMHRRQDIYGPDAKDFKPERWSADAPTGPLRPGWGYLPFNGGPRVCVGQQYALTEASYTIVRLLQMLERIDNRDPDPWVEGYGLTLCSGNGTKVALTMR